MALTFHLHTTHYYLLIIIIIFMKLDSFYKKYCSNQLYLKKTIKILFFMIKFKLNSQYIFKSKKNKSILIKMVKVNILDDPFKKIVNEN